MEWMDFINCSLTNPCPAPNESYALNGKKSRKYTLDTWTLLERTCCQKVSCLIISTKPSSIQFGASFWPWQTAQVLVVVFALACKFLFLVLQLISCYQKECSVPTTEHQCHLNNQEKFVQKRKKQSRKVKQKKRVEMLPEEVQHFSFGVCIDIFSGVQGLLHMMQPPLCSLMGYRERAMAGNHRRMTFQNSPETSVSKI